MRKSQQRQKKRKVKTPGARTSVHFKKKRPNYHQCAKCGKKLNRARRTISEIRKVSKVKRRAQRPYPELCSKCMRLKIKEMIR